MEHEKYMAMALELALKGEGEVCPNPLVGCVIVNQNRLIAQGWHARCGDLHAERHALQRAKESVRGATLYVTLEPCNHHGRTPPCTEAIIEAGIKKVVIACKDPNPIATGGIARLEDAGVEVITGVLETDAIALNEAFFHHTRTGLPWVTWKTAMTLDGRVAPNKTPRTVTDRAITSDASNSCVHKMRHAMSAILVGAGTVRSDNPSLTDRSGKAPCHPLRIIVGRDAMALKGTVLLATAQTIPTLFVTTDKNAALRLHPERTGLRIWTYPGESVPLADMLRRLGKESINSVLLEGGNRLAAEMLAAHLVHKISFFITPQLLGAAPNAAPVLAHMGCDYLGDALKLYNPQIKWYDGDLLYTAYTKEGQCLLDSLKQPEK